MTAGSTSFTPVRHGSGRPDNVAAVPPIRQNRFTAPTDATTIILVRHGESEAWDPDAPFAVTPDGQGDPALHTDGVEQAERLGRRLAIEHASQPFDGLYVTSLRRTAETAAPFARLSGLEPAVVPELREVFLGDWEPGLIRQKAEEGDPIVREIWRQQRWDLIPGAEPHDSFRARLLDGLRGVTERHRGGRVVTVVHGGVIGALLGEAAGTGILTFGGADNASISEIVVTGDRLILRRYNDTFHLTWTTVS